MNRLKTIFTNKIPTFLLVLVLTTLVLPLTAQAQTISTDQADSIQDQSSAFRQEAGFSGDVSIGGVVATVIKAAMGFLAIIFIVILIINGFKWMTAGGNEEQVKQAQQAIKRAIIGLIIVVAAYSITYFVFDVLSDAGSGGSGTMPP